MSATCRHLASAQAAKLFTKYSAPFKYPCLSRTLYHHHHRQHDPKTFEGHTHVRHCSGQSNNGAESMQTRQSEERLSTSDAVDFSKMTAEECEIHHIHEEACKAGKDTYIDPATGYTVLTRRFQINKGKCCGNACRHCPYNHKAVPEEHRKKRFNSSFYV